MKYVKLAQMPPMDPMMGMGMPAAPMAMPGPPAEPASSQKQIKVPLANLGLVLADAEIEKKLLEKINFISDVLIIADNRSFVSALLFVDDIAT